GHCEGRSSLRNRRQLGRRARGAAAGGQAVPARDERSPGSLRQADGFPRGSSPAASPLARTGGGRAWSVSDQLKEGEAWEREQGSRRSGSEDNGRPSARSSAGKGSFRPPAA